MLISLAFLNFIVDLLTVSHTPHIFESNMKILKQILHFLLEYEIVLQTIHFEQLDFQLQQPA